MAKGSEGFKGRFSAVHCAIAATEYFRHDATVISRNPSPALLLLLSLFFAGSASLHSQQKTHLAIDSPFGSFVEDEFPFFTQTLDARTFGEAPESTNLTPRGILVKFGNGYFGCFDPDLLRWSLIWKANRDDEYLTMDGMAPGSYRLPNRKAPAGQENLPRPLGKPLFASPAIPGWAVGPVPSDADPRPAASSEVGELGLGPIPAETGRFSGIRLITGGVRIEYSVGSTTVTETIRSTTNPPSHTISIHPHEEALWIRRGKWEEIPPGDAVTVLDGPVFARASETGAPESSPPPAIWTSTVTTAPPEISPAEGTLVYDDIPLPLPNPWQRNIRLAGFDFFPDGRAVLCTFDGDLWIAEGIGEGSDGVSWSRFASGLHEPKTVSLVDAQIYVSDRNGITRLHDTDGNGEADWYENFSNIVPQTAETREFAMDMVAAKEGGFFVAKGGQIGSTRGIANGTVVKISPDGRDYEIVATGLRQPYLGYDPETGILTSSDQQGHWRPATPIYRIEAGKYYGFQPAKLKDKAIHPAPIAPPEIWIPHFINPSGASQVWLKGAAQMGELNGSLIHLGYNRPEIFKILLSGDRTQATVVPLLSGFPAGILKGRVHPLDGRLYVSGFEIWGTSGERVSGLFRIRPGGTQSFIPKEIRATKRGVLLVFGEQLSEELAPDITRYSVDRWNYEQSHHYGSGNFRLDGTPGQKSVPVSSAILSQDRKSLFLGLPGMEPSHSLRVTYRLPHPEVTAVESVYLTVHTLPEMNLTSRGFESNTVDLTKGAALAAGPEIEASAKLGEEVATRYGCLACHATEASGVTGVTVPAGLDTPDGASQIAVGPAWTGLWNSKRTFTDGSFINNADETYLIESILDPGRRVTDGFATEKTGVGMPSYLGVLKDHEIESIILYIKTLK